MTTKPESLKGSVSVSDRVGARLLDDEEIERLVAQREADETKEAEDEEE